MRRAALALVMLLAGCEAAPGERLTAPEITADTWNRIVVDAGCPEATGANGDLLVPLLHRFADCLARQRAARPEARP